MRIDSRRLIRLNRLRPAHEHAAFSALSTLKSVRIQREHAGFRALSTLKSVRSARDHAAPAVLLPKHGRVLTHLIDQNDQKSQIGHFFSGIPDMITLKSACPRSEHALPSDISTLSSVEIQRGHALPSALSTLRSVRIQRAQTGASKKKRIFHAKTTAKDDCCGAPKIKKERETR